MKRNVIRIFVLVGAISAGAVAHADSGFRTGHHEFRAQGAGANTGVQTKSRVTHYDFFSDGRVTPGNVDVHSQNSQSQAMPMARGKVSSHPLPPEAGRNR